MTAHGIKPWQAAEFAQITGDQDVGRAALRLLSAREAAGRGSS
jgi:hypothetical protein